MESDLGYAERKVAEAEDALSNAIAMSFSVKKFGLETDFGVAARQADLRQWREFRTLVLIRNGMLNTAGLSD
ncbi:hypothetical protein [Chenggangzhangella methanolivorans]|uniref:Uncharacterized protein n=1 Tax=Chenggangzhangella methanolivorans TaxID=1437009 RepID=A0A9E6R6Y6_9HYPH|nr:hypothetical protein [Chenggangzhangella methanolivorans]QZN98541.1 hypothetical protein K6K41_16015 [Chenggangzhangella methanolivorans]